MEEFVLQNALEHNCRQLAIGMLHHPQSQVLRKAVISRKEFAAILINLLKQGEAQSFINACTEELRNSGLMLKIEGETIVSALMRQF
jgi:hypothetical protein